MVTYHFEQEKGLTAFWIGLLNNEESELSLLHIKKHLLVLLFILTKYESNPLMEKGNK